MSNQLSTIVGKPIDCMTDRRYLGHALRAKTAGAYGPDLAKKLSQLVKMEKNVMRSLETVAKERMEVAVRCYYPVKKIKKREWQPG